MDSLKKIKIGIDGLDEMLNGGLPAGRGFLLVGAPGTGKTVLLSEFLYRGATNFNQNGVFVTFEERPTDIINNVKSFHWNWDDLIKNDKLCFVDVTPSIVNEEVSEFYRLTPLLERIKYAVKKTKARRVAIDGIANLFQKFSNRKTIREFIYAISDELKKLGIVFMISSEKSHYLEEYSVEEYVSDGVISMSREEKHGQFVRNLEIIKLRGTSYLSGKTFFEITDDGIKIFPRFHFDENAPRKKTNVKCKFGIPVLDKALGGGLPEGSITVLVGATGLGKTSFSMQFICEGLKNGQNGLVISFKDSLFSMVKISDRFGCHFPRYIKQNKLGFITSLQHPDKLIYTVTGEIERLKAKRVIFDSIAFVDPLVAHPDKVTLFYINLIRWLRIKNITGILNYLPVENDCASNEIMFSELEAPLRRVLNALPDGIINLQYEKSGDKVGKLLNILKIRYNNHSKDYFSYTLNEKGFEFEKTTNLLTTKKKASTMEAG